MINKERFEAKFTQLSETECWPWQAARNWKGYGLFRVGTRMIPASRVSYELYIGAIPKDAQIMHICDVPSCVNPSHLRAGSGKDNIQDMLSKGRGGRSKLTSTEVAEIKALLADAYNQEEIACRFNISQAAVSLINTGRVWRDIE